MSNATHDASTTWQTAVAEPQPLAHVSTAPRTRGLTGTDLIHALTLYGYCQIPQVYTRAEVDRALALSQNWYIRGQDQLTRDVPLLNRNQPMVYNLENKDYTFLEMLFQPRSVHEVLMHFLNDKWYRPIPADQPNYILRSFLARSSNEALPLHIDSFMPYIAEESFIMQVSIILEDQDEENGCTIVLPGSHRTGHYADRSCMADCVPIISKAGDIVIWDSRLWHGTTANTSPTRTRWAMIATFSRWWIKQNFNMVENIPQHIYERLTDSQKALLGFCSIPFNDETQGIDMKQGYGMLQPTVAAYGKSPRYHPS